MMMPEQINNRLLLFMLFIFAAVAIFFSVENFKLLEREKLEQQRIENIKTKIDNAAILAKAVAVYDISHNKKIYGKNDDVVMPIASLAKILTVAVALNNYPKDAVISIPSEAINQSGDFGLLAEERWKVGDLAKLTLLTSANDGIYTLATGADFLEKVNTKAHKIGAQNAVFLNSTGLDIDLEHAGAFVSASDINTIAMYATKLYPEIFEATRTPELNLQSESGFVHNFKNTNVIVNKIPNLIFSKTGFTELAGGNLVIIFKNQRGEEIAVTILGSTFEGRFEDMEKIVNTLYSL